MCIDKLSVKIWIAFLASIITYSSFAQNYSIGEGFNPVNPGNPGSNGWNSSTGEVIVDDFVTGNLNGTITQLIGNSGASAVTQIVVAGVINSTDFRVANNYENCTLVDFSRTAGITFVPSSAYSGNTHLCSILLPTSITDIGSNAFNGCSALTSITCYTLTPPNVGANAFNGVTDGLVVYVPSDAVAFYQEADVWKEFTILPISDTVHSLTINFPNAIDMALYKNMNIEIVNMKSGQSYKYLLTDRRLYVFDNLVQNTIYSAIVKNTQNSVFGRIDSIAINTDDVDVMFESLTVPQTVTIKVMAGSEDVTSQTITTWTDSLGNYMRQGSTLTSLAVGTKLSYSTDLSQNLSLMYKPMDKGHHIVSEGNNSIVCQLEEYEKVTISGKVKDVMSAMPLSGVTISASQTFGTKYGKTTSTKTDEKGNYSITVYNVPTSLSISMNEYISQTLTCELTGNTTVEMPDVALKPITGAIIALTLTYTECPTSSDDDDNFQEWYSDYNNVSYSIYNLTKRCNITKFNVQYPQIVLLEDVDEGDVLELTATSRVSSFRPTVAKATINGEQRAEAVFNIVELGKIKASFANNSNETVIGILYDSNGKLVKSYEYTNASLTIDDIADGSYTLITMGKSSFFNSIYDINQLRNSGLTFGTDYKQSDVDVRSGVVTTVNIDEVPTLDESKLYYTGENTSFTVNKSSIVIGNYLTLTGHVDFKSAYSTGVGNVNLVVDLPESCSFVENSVMVGNSTSGYSMNGSRITIPMAKYTDRVRFCIIPTQKGEYAPSAFVKFDLNGSSMSQPIGSANFTAKELTISVPSTVAKTTIPVSGTAIGSSDVEIYDNDVLIGQTKSLANGLWTTTCELNKPYNLSKHNIYAKVKTQTGLELPTETMVCQYDKNSIEVKTVTMINTAHTAANLKLHDYVTVFDFQNPPSSIPPYWYWPSYPNFTFIVEFTNNDTTKISDIVLHVFTSSSEVRNLHPVYDKNLNAYVVSDKFISSALPETVSVSFNSNTKVYVDAQQVTDSFDSAKRLEDNLFDESLNNLLAQLDSVNDETNENIITKEIYDRLNVKIEQREVTDFDAQLKEVEDNLEFPETPLILSGDTLDIISDGNHCQIFISKYSENKGSIDISEFIQSELNDGSKLYYRANDNLYEFINVKEDIFVSLINRKNNNATYAKRMSGMDALQVFVTTFENYETIIKGLNKDLFSYQLELLSKINGSIAKSTSELNQIESLLGWIEANGKREQYYMTFIDLRNQRRAILRSLSLTKYAFQVVGVIFKAINIWSTYEDAVYAGESLREWIEIIRTIENTDCPGMEELAEEAMEYARFVGVGYSATLAADVATLSSLKTTLSQGIAAAITLAIGDFAIIQNGINKIYDIRRKGQIRNKIPTLKCKSNAPIPPKPYEPRSPHVMDPSGYVYEGVSSNRLEGVTATAYYKETVEDIYGDTYENIVKWDASEYAQENPLFTDENGMYAWDVPQGLWQVKFEKDGYETTYSEWLPVPPPQLDINIAMKQNLQPNVKTARAFEDAVEVEFGKYMQPELLTADNIIVMSGGMQVDGEIELLNQEAIYEGATESFASKVRFNASAPFETSEVTLIVRNNVKSYANIRMQDDFSQTFTIEPEIRSIVSDPTLMVIYGESGQITASVSPAAAAVGKTLIATSSSPMILSVERESAIIGEDGTASFIVNGELPGTAALTFSIEGYDITSTTDVNVELLSTVATANPRASIASGSTVDKGTTIYLSCSTDNATIYYTMDGSCPCDETAARMVYDGTPITVNESVTIKAMAVSSGKYDSDIVEFSYTVKGVTANPTSSIASGSIVDIGTNVYLSCETEGATIYYTLDGSSPSDVTSSRMVYDGTPITINESVTIKAMAVSAGKYDSDVVEFSYTVKGVTANPTASIASGSIVDIGTNVYLSCETEGATIYYTLDGSSPSDVTSSRMVYDGTPITINESVTIKAMAVSAGKYDSDVVEFSYTVKGVAANPTASIASGSIVDIGTNVYLSCETEGATIYYTLDGSSPSDVSSSRMVYDGTPITINESVTIKAMAVSSGKYDSDVVEFSYTVKGVAANPTASIASGSIVDIGTNVYLSCETEGATIYYTLDGSSPSDVSSSRMVYDGTPITINESVTIKAMAVSAGKYDSDVVEFSFFVNGGTRINDVSNNAKLSITPIPVKDKMNVYAEGETIKKVIIQSVNGEILVSKESSSEYVSMNVEFINTGIYIVTVVTTGNKYIRKFVKA